MNKDRIPRWPFAILIAVAFATSVPAVDSNGEGMGFGATLAFCFLSTLLFATGLAGLVRRYWISVVVIVLAFAIMTLGVRAPYI